MNLCPLYMRQVTAAQVSRGKKEAMAHSGSKHPHYLEFEDCFEIRKTLGEHFLKLTAVSIELAFGENLCCFLVTFSLQFQPPLAGGYGCHLCLCCAETGGFKVLEPIFQC